MTATVRAAQPRDAAAVAGVYVASWNDGFAGLLPRRIVTPETVRRWRDQLAAGPPAYWWVAELEGNLAGVAGIGPSRDPADPGLGELDTIAVLPSRWRMGVGRSLLAVAVRQLALCGYRQAILWTLRDLPGSRCFYEALGWRTDGGVRDEGRQVRYRRALRPA